MKLKHIWSVLCKESIVNQDDNVMTLSGVLEEVTINIMPNQNSSQPVKVNLPLNYEIASYWIRDEDAIEQRGEVEVIMISPSGKELINKVHLNIVMPIGMTRIRTRIKIVGLPVENSGRYYFKVRIKEHGEEKFKTVSEIPLDIKLSFSSGTKNQTTKN